MTHVGIVGGGQAAGAAAEALRDEGFDGDITVVAAEPHPPYQRPPLSKGCLAGSEGADAVILHSPQWYAERGIDLRAGVAATGLDTGAGTLTLPDGSALACDALLLATGATPRRLDVPGADLPGVMMLRTIEQSDALAAELRGGGRRVAVVGGGWIGLEVAATARGLGNEVTVLHRGRVPLSGALGEDMGAVFAALHDDHGVVLRPHSDVDRIVGSDRVTGVGVGGDVVPADLVIVGIGAAPDVALAAGAGLRVDDGILVDASLRTSAPGVWAAGDVARAYHPVLQRHLRVEHWANALEAGKVAARSMLGHPARMNAIPYFYTDQYDLGMELSGYPPLMAGADVVVRGDLDAREFVAFWIDDSRVVGGMNVNVWDVNDTVQSLIRSGARVDVARLTDPGTDLGSLLA